MWSIEGGPTTSVRRIFQLQSGIAMSMELSAEVRGSRRAGTVDHFEINEIYKAPYPGASRAELGSISSAAGIEYGTHSAPKTVCGYSAHTCLRVHQVPRPQGC
jgi:hypothetical protein